MITTSALRPTDLLDDFDVPAEFEADRPPESRGLARDDVKLMVWDGDVHHQRFKDLDEILTPGDLLVVNNSETIPAAVWLENGLVVHFSTVLPGGLQVVEIREAAGDGTKPKLDLHPSSLPMPDDGRLELLAPYPVDSPSRRLWAAHLDRTVRGHLLQRHGQPIHYRHSKAGIPMSAYQTVFAREPGSAEMPSAGRPFSTDLVTRLVAAGVGVAPVTLHTGVSSLEAGEAPYPEQYEVSSSTAGMINETKAHGGRVIAVGTTVVRALHTVTDVSGRAHAGAGWTDVVIASDTNVRVIDGMITGWHEPRSSHLDMLVAVGGREAIALSYTHALDQGYLWHEFGDSHLIFRSER